MLLEVEDLQAGYAQVPVVKGIRLSLREGEIAGIVGESGCGKSTFLRSLMVLDGRQNILGGSIRFAGTDLLSLSEEELRRIRGKDMVMIFQNAARASDPLKTIGHQFYETMRSHCGKVSKKECWQKAEAVLQQLHFPDPHRVLKSYSFELSGGMNQRAAIALALLLGPRLMLADEPTSALDVTAQAQVIKQMQALRETTRTAILLVTHNIGVVAQLCDQVGVMYAGRLVEWGTVREVLESPAHPYTQALLRSIPDMQGEPEGIPGTPPDFTEEISGCAFAPRCPLACETCRTMLPETCMVSEGHWALCPYGKGGGV